MGYSPWGRKESDTTERLDLLTYNSSQVRLVLHSRFKDEKITMPIICVNIKELIYKIEIDSWTLKTKVTKGESRRGIN